MSLKDTINQDIKAAMRAKDQAALRALRAVKSAIMLAETAEGRDQESPLTDDEGMKILIKQAKQRKDSIDSFVKNGRDDLVAKEQEELDVISKYLPQQLSTEEIAAKVKEIVERVGATSMKDMGKVMGLASKELAGKADGKAISGVVKQLLN
ncbi:MAG: GatB/YqeY domain-containing protein [Bacteroidota bacterium]